MQVRKTLSKPFWIVGYVHRTVEQKTSQAAYMFSQEHRFLRNASKISTTIWIFGYNSFILELRKKTLIWFIGTSSCIHACEVLLSASLAEIEGLGDEKSDWIAAPY
jgi:hypothetical protein